MAATTVIRLHGLRDRRNLDIPPIFLCVVADEVRLSRFPFSELVALVLVLALESSLWRPATNTELRHVADFSMEDNVDEVDFCTDNIYVVGFSVDAPRASRQRRRAKKGINIATNTNL